MGKEQFLVVFGGILFGLSASFYLHSYVRLIREDSFFKEKLYVGYSMGFFILTLIDWYVTYDVVQFVDQSIGHYLLTFVEIGFLFIISGMINPDNNQKPGWKYLSKRTGNIMVVATVTACWGLLVPFIFEGIPFLINPLIALIPVLFVIIYFITKKNNHFRIVRDLYLWNKYLLHIPIVMRKKAALYGIKY